MDRLMKKSGLLALCTGLSLAVHAVTPQAEAPAEQNVKIDSVVVTGARYASDIRHLPMTVSVVGREKIEQSLQPSLLPTLTEQVPGLFTTARGIMGYGVSDGAAGGISLRGLSGGSGRLMVLIDGHPQYMGLMGHPIADAYQSLMAERVEVLRGPTNDGLGEYYRQMIEESDAEPVDVAQVLRDKKVDVLVSYLPVGSEQADKAYAQAAMDAGCAFVNCLPVFIASDPEWAQKFRDAGVPIVGDDIKSQVGATITHRVLARLFEDRGVRLDRTYQLNVGGNMDFMNMLQRSRLESKKISKTRAVTSVVPHEMDPHNVHIGPSDYVAWLDDRKFAFVRLEGTTFGDVPLNLEYKLEVWDSPNSAGIVIDAVRAAKIALDRHLAGPVLAPSSYFMKSPAVQHEDGEARRLVEEFIKGEVEGTEEQLDADVAAAKAAGKDVWRA